MSSVLKKLRRAPIRTGVTICSGIVTEYMIPPFGGPMLYVVTAEKLDGRCYDYKTYDAANALVAQQCYEYIRGSVAVLASIPHC